MIKTWSCSLVKQIRLFINILNKKAPNRVLLFLLPVLIARLILGFCQARVDSSGEETAYPYDDNGRDKYRQEVPGTYENSRSQYYNYSYYQGFESSNKLTH
ncbi:hypothetical protein IT774_07720 [Salinimonas marina]|uniref:Uncharacterized protein n=1 Tax=Salinimonas marina TaxID=2785918 RepID=A0A7S9DZV8_9ALTE|nr:hypothetical protein [Salinimonas marina]QPG06983.1 hypothetical protein IT774_07720 [Salinimonas marina]